MKPFITILLLLLMLVCPAYAFSGNGSGTAADPYLISTPAQFLEIKDIAANKYYRLTDDLDMTGKPWGGEPIIVGTLSPGFTLDGDGHIVSNLVINSSTGTSTLRRGMFSGGGSYPLTFKDIVFENPVLSGAGASGSGACDMGFLVTYYGGDGNWTFERVGIVNGTLTMTDGSSSPERQRNGMFVGSLFGGNLYFKNCFATGTITNTISGNVMDAGGFVGGVPGSGKLTMEECYVDVAFVNATQKGAFFGNSVEPTTKGVSFFNSSQASYYDAGSHTKTAIVNSSASAMRDKETYVNASWDIPSTWEMSALDSPLEGYPALSFMEDYLPVEPDLQISLTPSTAFVGKPLTVTWEDLPESDGTEHMVRVERQGGGYVYTNETAGKSGSASLILSTPATYFVRYSATFNGSTTSVNDSFTVEFPAVEAAVVNPELFVDDYLEYRLTSVTPAYDSYSVVIYNPSMTLDMAYQWSTPLPKSFFHHVTESGEYSVGLWGRNDGVYYQITPAAVANVTPFSLPAGCTIAIDADMIGAPATVLWARDPSVTQLPYSREPIASSFVQITRGVFNTSEADVLLENPVTGDFGSITFTPTTDMPWTGWLDEDTYSAVLWGVSTTGTYEVLAQNVSTIPFVYPTAHQDTAFLGTDENLVFRFSPNSVAGMDSYTWSICFGKSYVLHGEILGIYPIANYTTGSKEVVSTTGDYDYLITIPHLETYPLINPGDGSSDDETYHAELLLEPTGSEDAETWGPLAQWVIFPAARDAEFRWCSPANGATIQQTTAGANCSLYLKYPVIAFERTENPVVPDTIDYLVYLQRYNPVTEEWEELPEGALLVDKSKPIAVAWLEEQEVACFEQPFPEGLYRAVMYWEGMCNGAPNEGDSGFYVSPTLRVTPNYLNPDFVSKWGGDIFGIDVDALKWVAGVVLVVAFAAAGPIIWGNTHPMVILLGGICGVISGIALGLLPLWIAFLLAIIGAALVVMNVSGGGKTYISTDYSGPSRGGGGGGFSPPPGGDGGSGGGGGALTSGFDRDEQQLIWDFYHQTGQNPDYVVTNHDTGQMGAFGTHRQSNAKSFLGRYKNRRGGGNL